MKYLDVRYYAYGLANYVYKIKNTNSMPCSHNDRYILFYAWRIHIANILQVSILGLIGFLLNIHWLILLAAAAFISLRFYAGGAHTNSLIQCTTTSIIIMLTSVYIGRLINLQIEIPLLIIAFILLMIFSPADHKNRPIVSEQLRKLHKTRSIVIFILWVVIVYFYPSVSGIITMAMFIECLSLIKKKAVATA